MKARPLSPRLSMGGFTLIELLTSITVLTLMLLMISQLVNSTAAVMSTSGRHLDADTQARLIFNRMSVDFAGMPKRTDVDYSTFKQPSNLQTGNDQMAFYSGTHGYFSGTTQPTGTGKADLSLIAYTVANDSISGTPTLQRMGKGLGWQPDSSGAWSNVAYLPVTLTGRWTDLFQTTNTHNSPTDADYRSIGDLVFRLEYTYLLKPTSTQAATLSISPYYGTSGHTTINGFKDVAAIVVTMAMLDSSSRQLVTNYTNLTSASATTFPDAVNGASPASTWNTNINTPTFTSAAGIPQTAASSVRVYERYFYLNNVQ